MNKKALLLAGALTVALLGCASAQQPLRNPQAKPLRPLSTTSGPYPQDRYSAAYCERSRCTITVKISAKCEISVDPQWMGISSKVSSPVLVWVLDAAPEFSFDVAFKPEDSNVKDPFIFDRTSTPRQITAQVRTSKAPAVYQYGITAKKGNTVCEILDPPIIVDM
jgi:hypothetical protein